MSVNVSGGALEFDAIINNSQFQAQILRMEADLKRLTQTANKQTASVESFAKKAASAAGAYLSLQAAGGFVQKLIQVRGEFQKLESSYRTMLGSKKASDELMAETVKLAAVTPFTLQEVAGGTKQLLAYGFGAKQVTQNLEMLGNVAAGVGAPLNDLVYLYGTLKASGRVTQMDINQFAGRGIPIYKELAKVMKVTEGEVRNLVSAGKIGFPEIEKAFQNLTGAGGMFFNLMQEQSKSLSGQMSNLEDAIDRMFNTIGANTQGVLNTGIQGAIYLVDNFEKVVDILAILVTSYGAYRAALMAEAALKQIIAARTVGMTAAEMLHVGALNISTAAQKAYNAALLASPIVAATATIAALGLAVYSLSQATDAASDIQDRNNNLTEAGNEAKTKERQKINDLVKVIQSQTATKEQQQAAYEKLQAAMGAHLKGYDLEAVKAGKAKSAITEYIAEVEKAARARMAFDEFSKLNDQLAELDVKGVKAMGTWERVGNSLKNTFAPTSQGIGLKEWAKQLVSSEAAGKQLVDQKRKSLQAQRDDLLKNFNKEITDGLTGNGKSEVEKAANKVQNKAYFEKVIKDNTDALEALDKNADDFKSKATAYRKKIADARNILNLWSDGKSESSQSAKFVDEQKKLLDEIAKARNEAFNDTLNQDEKEIQQAKDKYKALRDQIDEYNKTAPRHLKVNGQVVDEIEKKTTGNIRYEQDTRKMQEEIEKQKGIFEAYENFKQQFGTDAANERYQAELKGFKTFQDYVLSLQKANQSAIDATVWGTASGAEQARVLMLNKIQADEKRKQQAHFDDLVASLQSYEQKRALIIQQFAEKRKQLEAAGKKSEIIELDKQQKTALNAIDDEYVKSLPAYKSLFDGIENMSKKAAAKVISDAETMLKALREKGLISADLAKEIQERITGTKAAVADNLPENLDLSAAYLRDIAGLVGQIDGGFGDLLNTLSGTVSTFAQITRAANAFHDAAKGSKERQQAAAELAIQGVQGLITVISTITGAAKARREAEEAYYRAVIQGQREYNLSLNDQIRLNAELNENVFLKDNKGRILSGTLALTDANKQYLKSLQDLSKGQAKIGQRNANDWNAIGKAAGGGAAVGAAIGTIIPGVGNAIGAAVGGVIGGIAGAVSALFGAKKKKDVFGGLLQEYPELILKAKDGTIGVNKELAKSLVSQNLVNDATKDLINNTLAWSEKVEAAQSQIKGVIADLAGGLGNDLRDSLVTAFKDGSDAAKAFGDDVNKIVEDIVSQFLFQELFSKDFDALQKEMTASYGLGGDNSIVDDLARFYKEASPKITEFNDALTLASKEAANMGLDIFKKQVKTDQSQGNSLAGGIKGITEDTAGVIAGQFGGLRLTNIEILNVSKLHLQQSILIELNTRNSAKYLESIDKKLTASSDPLRALGKTI